MNRRHLLQHAITLSSLYATQKAFALKTTQTVSTKELKHKKVLILHTGGTFGMKMEKSGKDNAPVSPQFLKKVLEKFPDLQKVARVQMKVVSNIDSSDAGPQLWDLLAQNIIQEWHHYDGFVIIHGTDTMAYTGCALSFLFPHSSKPIVLTGSQRPFDQTRGDARDNLLNSVELATTGIPRVMVCFDGKVHMASRVTKHSSMDFAAFKSHNAHMIGEFGVNFHLFPMYQNLIDEQKNLNRDAIQNSQMNFDDHIFTIKAIPGVPPTEKTIKLLTSSYRGLIIEGFGAGNLPLADKHWISLAQTCLIKKIPLVMASQCKAGGVSLELYKNGKVYKGLGVIPALDMTIEAATVKLMYMLGSHIPFDHRISYFTTPLDSECTPISHKDLEI